MSTPTPPNSKLNGLELYAPRWARAASAPSIEDPSPRELPPESAEDPPPEQNSDQQTEAESLEAAQARLEEAIRAAIDISYSSAGIEPPVATATLPRAANLVQPQADAVDEPPLAPDWLTRVFSSLCWTAVTNTILGPSPLPASIRRVGERAKQYCPRHFFSSACKERPLSRPFSGGMPCPSRSIFRMSANQFSRS